MTVPPKLPAPWWSKAMVICLQVMQAVSLLPWVVFAGLAFMAFDAPGSSERWEPWVFVMAIWSYPVWLVGAGLLAWWLLMRGRWSLAILLAALFTIPMPAFILVIALS